MKKTYQGTPHKSKQKFEVLGKRELLVEVPLPLIEVWEELQAQVEQLTGEAGLRIIGTILENEVTRRVGPPYRPGPESGALRWGRQPGYVVFGGRKVAVERPRVRTREGQEVELDSYARLQHDGRRQRDEVQRCQIHNRRNVKEHLPKNVQGDYDRRIRNAYAMTDYAAAKAELEKIFRQLERINTSAARSLEEGLEETLTVHRLGVGWLLRRTLASTNPIESCLSTVERVERHVKRWREGEQALRWTATGLLEAQKKFRRVKGYRELELLHRRMNPQCSCQSCQQHRGMNSSLTQQAQVA